MISENTFTYWVWWQICSDQASDHPVKFTKFQFYLFWCFLYTRLLSQCWVNWKTMTFCSYLWNKFVVKFSVERTNLRSLRYNFIRFSHNSSTVSKHPWWDIGHQQRRTSARQAPRQYLVAMFLKLERFIRT